MSDGGAPPSLPKRRTRASARRTPPRAEAPQEGGVRIEVAGYRVAGWTSVTYLGNGRCGWASWWTEPPSPSTWRSPDRVGIAENKTAAAGDVFGNTTARADAESAVRRAVGPRAVVVDVDSSFADAAHREANGQPAGYIAPAPRKEVTRPRFIRNRAYKDHFDPAAWMTYQAKSDRWFKVFRRYIWPYPDDPNPPEPGPEPIPPCEWPEMKEAREGRKRLFEKTKRERAEGPTRDKSPLPPIFLGRLLAREHFAMLGLDHRSARAEDVGRAFRAKAFGIHPDRKPESEHEAAEEAFKVLQAAYASALSAAEQEPPTA